jgi:phosphotransferase system  glucose/maltose/N-acetylglucosamine-specific IIC component
MEVLCLLILAVLGGWISRMCGGGWPLDGGIPKLLYAVPYGVIVIAFAGFGLPALVGAVLAFAGATTGKRTGHGQYITLGRYRQPEAQDERLDCIVRFFMGFDRGGNVKRDLVGLLVTGLSVTLLPGIVLMLFGQVAAGLVVVLSGAGKPLAYWIGHKYALLTGKKYSSLAGEVLTGTFGWGGLGVACLL